MDDRYTMIDDEAIEVARRKMDAFQRDRGLLSGSEPRKRIAALKAEIESLEALLKNRKPVRRP